MLHHLSFPPLLVFMLGAEPGCFVPAIKFGGALRGQRNALALTVPLLITKGLPSLGLRGLILQAWLLGLQVAQGSQSQGRRNKVSNQGPPTWAALDGSHLVSSVFPLRIFSGSPVPAESSAHFLRLYSDPPPQPLFFFFLVKNKIRYNIDT